MASCQGKCQNSTCNGKLYKCEKCGSVGCKKMHVERGKNVHCTNYIGQPGNPASSRCGRCGGTLKAL